MWHRNDKCTKVKIVKNDKQTMWASYFANCCQLTGRGCNLSESQSFVPYKYYQLLSSKEENKFQRNHDVDNYEENENLANEMKIEIKHKRSINSCKVDEKLWERVSHTTDGKLKLVKISRFVYKKRKTLNCNIIYETDSNSSSLSLQRG